VKAGIPINAGAAVVADRLAALFRDIVGITLPVRIRAWDGSEAGPPGGPVLVIRSGRALRRFLWAPGELGLARAYVCGDVDVDGDLADGFRLVWRSARRQDGAGDGERFRPTWGGRVKAALGAMRLGAIGTPPPPPAVEARLTGRRHSPVRDRAAIAHHYDLSNEFYRLLLDEHMTYSSAYFTNERQCLDDAQTAKLDLVCRKLDLHPGMRLLDVGCGWGSLICYAAKHYGVHATGITLSEQQRDFVAGRLAERRVDNVEVRLQDYREFGALPSAREAFDAVSSIEMGEHVGEEHYPAYARMLLRALKPTGRLLLQQMSRQIGTPPGGGAFIERYIAPDMHMRPLAQTLGYLQAAGFEVRDVEAMREHYVRTARHWIDTFNRRYDEFVALQGEQVGRVWRLYLVGGSLALEQGRMGVDQILAVKPTADGVAGMPWTRPWAVPAS
jgi:cyclopropane-fatty-acyl-phospholipid synthase